MRLRGYLAPLAIGLASCATPPETWRALPGYSGEDPVEYEVHSLNRRGQTAVVRWRVHFTATDGRAFTELWYDEFNCQAKERRILDASLVVDGRPKSFDNAAQALPGPWRPWSEDVFGFVPAAALTRLACSGAS